MFSKTIVVGHLGRDPELRFTPGGRVMEVKNTNRLLGTFPGVLGLKTGDTANAGEVLLSYAALAHDRYLAVVMGSPPVLKPAGEGVLAACHAVEEGRISFS